MDTLRQKVFHILFLRNMVMEDLPREILDGDIYDTKTDHGTS